MFKNFTGFNLVEQMHRLRQSNRFNPAILKKKSLGLIFVALTVLVLWFLPTESFGIEGLTPVQQRIIAIFVYATLMWVLELVPAWATSVSIIVFLLLCASDSGIKWICNPATAGPLLSYKQVMASFADPVVMLFIGGFVLAIATTKTGLDVHLARVLLTPFGKKSENILLGFMLVTALFSMFISNTATTAMMLTFLTPVFKQLPEAGKGRTAMALSIPIAANLGGMGTPIGTPPNTIALKYLNDPEGLNLGIGFGQWMLFMVPLVIVMILIAWMLLRKFFPFTQKTIELKIDGEMKRGRETTLVIVTMVVTILLWMMDTVTGINTYTVALVPFAVFALAGIVTKYDHLFTRISEDEDINNHLSAYLYRNYGGFIRLLRQCCKKYDIAGGIMPDPVPFCIGDVCFKNYCRINTDYAKDIVKIIMRESVGFRRDTLAHIEDQLRK